MFKKKTKQEEKTVRSGGPEGTGSSIESPSVSKSVESGNEALTRQPESAGERKDDKAVERSLQQTHKQQTQKQKPVPKKVKKTSAPGPKVYGYKLSPVVTKNMKSVHAKAGNGDPKTGLACLYVFVDRLLKMQGQ